MKQIFAFIVGILCILFLTSCTSFDIFKKNPKEWGTGGPLTPTIGGRGVVVTFVPGKPPLNEIDDSFSLGLSIQNYNSQDLSVEKFIVGSTYEHPDLPLLEGESLTLTGATKQGMTYAPGTILDYRGAGALLRDETLHYGDFYLKNIPDGVGTQFFVEMEIPYTSVFPFQFCVYDLQSSFSAQGCTASETISGSGRLGIDVEAAPVIVSSVKKTLFSDRNGDKIQLDFTLKDTSIINNKEQRHIVEQDVGQQPLELVSFSLASVGGGDAGFTCKSDTQLAASGGTTLQAYLRNKEMQVRCTGYSTLLEERFDYQYQITLEYLYYQRVSTPYIPLRTTEQKSFS